MSLITIFAFCGKAHAMGPIDVEAGARVGYGTNPIGGSNPNPLGVGIGARAGIAVLGIYGGVAIDYYFGESNAEAGAVGSLSEHALKYGGEIGYSIKLLELITLRPQIGIGNVTVYSSRDLSALGLSASVSGSGSNLYLEPGLVGLVSLGTVFVGADANALILPGVNSGGQSSTDTAFTVHGQVGVKF